MKKTWQEKIADKSSMPKVLTLEKRFPCYNAVHKMGAEAGDQVILVNPSEIWPLMAKIPKGKVTTVIEICKSITKKHQVKGCCSLTTGIFIMSIANAIEEAIENKEHSEFVKIPYWRTLKADGFLNEKYPGGQEKQKQLLEKEELSVTARGKNYQVKNYQQYLFS